MRQLRGGDPPEPEAFRNAEVGVRKIEEKDKEITALSGLVDNYSEGLEQRLNQNDKDIKEIKDTLSGLMGIHLGQFGGSGEEGKGELMLIHDEAGARYEPVENDCNKRLESLEYRLKRANVIGTRLDEHQREYERIINNYYRRIDQHNKDIRKLTEDVKDISQKVKKEKDWQNTVDDAGLY